MYSLKTPSISLFLVFLFLLSNKFVVDSARILSIFHTPSKSHMLLAQPLMFELAKSGHEVTIATAFPIKNPPKNVRCIPLPGLEAYYDPYWETAFEHTEDSPLQLLNEFIVETTDMTNITLQHANIKKLYNSNETFDLLFMEAFQNDAFLGIAHHFNCPVIAMSTIGVTSWSLDLTGTPAPMSFVPNGLLSFRDKMNLQERLINILFSLYDKYLLHMYYLPNQEKIYNKEIPDPKPSFRELRKNKVSLVLLNNHFSLNVPRPLLPNVIEVGGMQINQNPAPLPQDLEDFINSAKHGVIFFSMGGNLWPSRMTPAIKQSILKSLNKVKQKVIWKWDETLDVDPNRFLIKKWLPQDSILAHPNVKLFITHGGWLSLTESVHHGVPMIGIPIFGDQMANMNTVKNNGWGVRLDYQNLTENSLDWALTELLGSKKYKENVQKTSNIYRDQPLKPLETAKFWVEYVIRHKGAPHIKSAATQLSIIELYNIDAYLILLIVVLLVVLVLKFIVQTLIKLFIQKSNKVKVS